MDYREVFLYKKFLCFHMEEFIFMVNFDEIEFLDCEIVDDDPDAPVGTLVHVNEDGTIDTVTQDTPEAVEVATVEQEAQEVVADEPIEEVVEDNSIAQEASEPQSEIEVAQEQPQESISPIESEPVQDVQEEVVKPAPKKKATTKKSTVKLVENNTNDTPVSHTGMDLKGGESVNDALFSTSFEIQQPAKAKVVSTKKKQEKQEDLWAVASINKPKKEAQPVEEKQEEVETPAPKKTARKKSTQAVEPAVESEPAPKKKPATKKTTNVENTINDTEDNNVAKATDKTPAPQEEKAVKAPKATKAVENNDETILVEGEGKIHGKFVIKKTDKGNFVFKLYSSNHRVVAIGAQAYTTLGAAKIGVQSVIKNAENAPIENQTLKNVEVQKFPKWEIYTDKKGEFRLRLFATNGSLIATTNDGYADISGAKNGIAAVARACKGCAIARNDNLW